MRSLILVLLLLLIASPALAMPSACRYTLCEVTVWQTCLGSNDDDCEENTCYDCLDEEPEATPLEDDDEAGFCPLPE